VEDAFVTSRHNLRPIGDSYREQDQDWRVEIKPDEGQRLAIVHFKLTALSADSGAIEKLISRRTPLAKVAPGVGKVLLLLDEEDRRKLTGKYRMFDMEELALIDQNGKRYRPRWAVYPSALHMFIKGTVVQCGGMRPEQRGWQEARKTNDTFTALLEVHNPVNVSLLFSIPKLEELEDLTLQIEADKPLALEVEPRGSDFEEKANIIAEIERLGGKYWSDGTVAYQALVGVNLSFRDVSDADLEQLKGLTSLTYLDLSGTKVTDAGLKHLKGLSSLQTLYLAGTKVTHVGADRLKKALPNLEVSR